MKIAVYCGSTGGKKACYVEEAKALGSWFGENGHTVIYGGSNTGMMGAVADATLASGGSVIGVVPNVPVIQARTHTSLTELIETTTMAQRKEIMMKGADAYFALPGGIGTLDEITEIISLSSLHIIHSPIVFFNTDGYYNHLKEYFEAVVESGFGKEEYFQDILFSNDLEEIGHYLTSYWNKQQ